MAHLLHQFLSETAASRPHHTALIAGDTAVTFAELDRRSDAVACALQSAGVVRGDRVAVRLENSIEYVAGLFGAATVGVKILYVQAVPAILALAALLAGI